MNPIKIGKQELGAKKMLSEIIDLQNRAVTKLVELTKTKNNIVFKAPTGSGKTYMMADYMSRIIADNPNVCFLVSTLSKGELAKQNYDKFNEYIKNDLFPNLKPFLIMGKPNSEAETFIPLDYNVYILPHAQLTNGSLIGRGPFDKFITAMTLPSEFSGQGKEFYLIKDEGHVATNNLDNISIPFQKKLLMTATPKNIHIDCEITETEAVNNKLIKHVEYFNSELNGKNLEDAIYKFKEVKEKYTQVGLSPEYNPCLIIQVSNDYKDDKQAEIEVNEVIRPLLEKHKLRWAVLYNEKGKKGKYDAYDRTKIAGKSLEWLKEDIKQNSSIFDVAIFKMAISEGYDIPRACMLYQLRKVQSTTLEQQVIGRVRRVPKLTTFENLDKATQDIATTAYVWATPQEDTSVKVKLDEINQEIQAAVKIKTTILKSINLKNNFDVKKFIDSQDKSLKVTNIFTLYKSLKKCDYNIRQMCDEYSTDYSKWWQFNENLSAIKNKIKTYACDYTNSMILSANNDGTPKYVSFSPISKYISSNKNLKPHNWVWIRDDGKKEFSFDSEAEKEWADFLDDISGNMQTVTVGNKNPNAGQIDIEGNEQAEKIKTKEKNIWGKNFLQNSEIKFEYYLDGVHSSYPDFIMKDAKERTYIFEVKSVNESSTQLGINTQVYSEKVKELMKCYQQASKLTEQIFCIPQQQGNSWNIYVYQNGNLTQMTESQFEAFVSN